MPDTTGTASRPQHHLQQQQLQQHFSPQSSPMHAPTSLSSSARADGKIQEFILNSNFPIIHKFAERIVHGNFFEYKDRVCQNFCFTLFVLSVVPFTLLLSQYKMFLFLFICSRRTPLDPVE
jgi:hypothetical protein